MAEIVPIVKIVERRDIDVILKILIEEKTKYPIMPSSTFKLKPKRGEE